MRKWQSCSILLLLLTATNGQQLDDKVTVCKICSCDGTTLDCKDKGMQNVFTEQFWSDVKNETIADFDSNKIGHITAYPNLPFVELRLSFNKIVSIDRAAFRNLTSLKVLFLDNNELTSENLQPEIFQGKYDPTDFQPLKIEYLDLSHNALHTLHQDLFEHLSMLKKLRLANNPFKILDHPTMVALGSLGHLESIDLSYLQLKNIPEQLLHSSKNLSEVALKGNLLRTVPTDALSYSHNLEILNLNENPIIVISKIRGFPPLPSLKQLHISFMPDLIYIDEFALSGLSGLEYLDCQSNPLLEAISENALRTPPTNTSEGGEWPPLTTLLLNDNALVYLDSTLVGRWDKLDSLDISGNEWSCDCQNQWLISTLVERMKTVLHSPVADLKCEEPEEMRGIPFETLQKKNYTLRCLDLYGAHPSQDSTILVVVFVVVIIIMVVTGGVFWLRNNRDYCRKGGRVPYGRAFYKPADTDDYGNRF